MRRAAVTALSIFALAAGLAAGAMTGGAHAAASWNIQHLPDGYTINVHVDASAPYGTCGSSYIIDGYGSTITIGYGAPAGIGYGDCNPDFQRQLDAFINATYVPPATTAVTTAPTAATTTTSPVVTETVAAPTTTDVVTVDAPPAAVPPAVTTTETVTVTVVDPAVNDRLTALEQRQQTDEARIATLEEKAGIIVGEPKNTAPFTNPV